MSQQRLDDIDKLLEEIIIFGNVDYKTAAGCTREVIKHFPGGSYEYFYMYHSLRSQENTTNLHGRAEHIKVLREVILNEHREDNQ